MAPYYGPDEPEATIQVERFFIAGDVTVGIGYGIQLALYYSCAMYLWSRRKQSRKALFLLAFISLQLSVWTIFVIVQARTIQLMYVDNRNYPGGPWSYFLATQNLAVDVMFDATLFIMTFLSDSLMLWRCWVIWTSSGILIASLVITFPAVILLASFVMGTLWTLESTHPGLSFYSKLPLAFGTSYYSISLGVNIVLTILITIRLLVYRRQMLDSLPPEHAKHYLSLLTIMVESAAIYSLFALLFLITYAINNPANQILLAFSWASQQIVNYLIIYRLVDGRAWKRDTLHAISTRNKDGKTKGIDDKNNRGHNLSAFHAATVGLSVLSEDLENSSSDITEIHRQGDV